MRQSAPTGDLKQLGKLLREQRNKSGLSFDELCTALGKEKGSVSRWELGKLRPKPELLRRWAKILNLDIAQLYTLAGYSELLGLKEEETSLSNQPMALANIKHWSTTLADFVQSEKAQDMRLTWQEIRQMLAVPFTVDRAKICAECWQELLLLLRKIEGKDSRGDDNEEQDLVWSKLQLLHAGNPIIE